MRAIALVCFFFSGATGLLYEVVWTRLLGTTIGNSHYSITVVVSVFMGGLALGSIAGGRIADRSASPLRLYGFLNLLAALFCLAVPFATEAGKPLFGWLYRLNEGEPDAAPILAARVAFAGLLILGPTTCMGATLPALARYFTRRLSDVGATLGRLYAINTAGAVFGVFFAGFWAMEHLGVLGTTGLAVGIDLAIAAVVFIKARGEPARIAPAPERSVASGDDSTLAAVVLPPARSAVAAFAVTGFANMLLQVAWTKTIVQTIGNSTYAFSLIVTLFILGIGLGGGAMAFIVDRLRRLDLALGALIALTGLVVAATIPLLGFFPLWGARLYDAVEQPDYDTFLRIQIGMVAVVVLPATLLMGAVFPVVGKIATRAVDQVGSSVGSAYFANTLGAILGTLAGGFLFIPLLGRVYWTLYLGAGISLAAGLVLIAGSRGLRPLYRAVAVLLLAAVALVPGYLLRPHGVLGSTSSLWDPAILSKGAYVYYKGSYYRDRGTREVLPVGELVAQIRQGNDVLWYSEGIHAPVAVVENATRGRAMRISGKVEASIPKEGGYNRDLPHQIMAGHLPMILHPDPRDVCTLGLGGGVTLGTLTLYPVTEVDSLEISPEVVDAARVYFAAANRGSLGEKPLRPVRNVIGDGRNHLLYTTKRYDVITSVPSNPWIAGIGNLFTTEFFAICRDRLEPGGLLCNWIHKINMRSEDLRTVFRTFTTVFPEHAQLWDLGYDCLLIGSSSPIRLDAARVAALLEQAPIRSDLQALGITDAGTLLRHYRWDAPALKSYAGSGPVNTDSFPVLEFSCPRGLYGHPLDAFTSLAEAVSAPLGDWVSGLEAAERGRAELLRRTFREFLLVNVRVDHFERIFTASRAAAADESFGVDPASGELAVARPSPGEERKLAAEYEQILELFGSLARALDESPDPWLEERAVLRARAAFGGGGRIGDILARHFADMAQHQTDPEKQATLLESALEWSRTPADLATQLARHYLARGLVQRGAPVMRAAAAKHAGDAAVLNASGVVLAASGDAESAMALFQKALTLPASSRLLAEVHSNIGFANLRAGDRDRARAHFAQALELDPENRQARQHLDEIEGRR